MSVRSLTINALQQGNGMLRLSPTWVPRAFCIPGRRIKLHPDDYYAYGGQRGGIDERWLSSVTPADNGPSASRNEGMSHVIFESNGKIEKFLLRDAIREMKSEIIGNRLWEQYGEWTVLSKFFDNKMALPFHIHQNDEYAALTGQKGKPEAYYFPPQLNNYSGEFPYTFFGLNEGTSREDIRDCLMNFSKGDNKITQFSKSYALRTGTGWDVPPGVLHAPGSLCTYEPQRASDVFAMYESLTGDVILPPELLWKNTPKEKVGDFDFLLEVINWDLNLDPDFFKSHFMEPKPVKDPEEMLDNGYLERWVCYKSNDFSAKELTIRPGQSVTIRDSAAYGMIMMQGYGKMGVWKVETPTLIRFGQLTHDEFFITEGAAINGVTITNYSETEPLVMLKHFGPAIPELD